MAPRHDHAIAIVYSTQVRSHDYKSIIVESGAFTPMRWFLERASKSAAEHAEPPKKRRKVEHDDQQTNTRVETIEEIPLFSVSIDLHFPESTDKRPPSRDQLRDDIVFDESQGAPIVPLEIETDEDGTRLRLSFLNTNSPILSVECTAIDDEVIEAFRKIAGPSHSRPSTTQSRLREHPATSLSCKLMQSTGDDLNVVRLQASLSWKSGQSAFFAGAPVGRARVYPDYEFLLNAFHDHAREAFDQSRSWSPQDFYESVHVPDKNLVTDEKLESVLESDLYPFQKRAITWMLNREMHTELATGGASSERLWTKVQDLGGRSCFVNHLQGIVSRTDPTVGATNLAGGLLAEEMGLGKTVELMALISVHRKGKMDSDKILDLPSQMHVTPSRATLIITPASILQQWQSELQRHAPNLSVHHYQGIPTSSLKVRSEESIIKELATSYDVVLTTYGTLAKEVHFAEDPPDRNMRHARKFDRKRSPLIQLQWWRICLDEAQMVESGVTAAARVARRLPRINSWAVTGTPLRKDVQDLHGLMIFLRHKPFADDARLWAHMVHNHRHLFRQLFSQIALRHTKAQIRDELRLPPQKRVVVTVPFSVVEQQNYSTLFEQMCDDVGLNNDGSPKDGEWNPDDSSTVETMRSWLVRLRQTCLHPQVGGKNRRALGRGAGPLRTVAEVLEVMIEQNETNLRVEERTLVSASLSRAHVLGNNGEDERRAEKALTIYTSVVGATEKMVEDARTKLSTAKVMQIQNGEQSSDGSEEEDSASESTPLMGRLKNGLRTALQLHHTCTFFAATAYFQIKTNEALTLEGSDSFKELETKETVLYDTAKILRKEILRETARKAESLMRKIKDMEGKQTITQMPSIKDLQSLGGIESRRIVEKSDELFDVIREQVTTIESWRAKMAEFLLKPLVDEENEGIETTGDEYEDSTKQQDELYVYFDAIKAIHADLNTFITGESAPLIDHEVKTLVRDAKWVLNPEIADDQKPTGVHAPELALELFKIRNKFRSRRDEVGSVRSLIQEARTLETSMSWNDSGTRAIAERAIAQKHLSSLQTVFSTYTKALNGLEKEVELFRTTQNQRVEFYRQLQELSDDVSPYKDELDPQLDQHALELAMHKEEQASNLVAQLKTKNRFLLHLREESGAQAGPRICIICTSTFERGVLTVCGHQFCKECILAWHQQARSCPMCKRHLTSHDMHDITFKPQELKAQEEVPSTDPSASQSSSSSAASSTTSLYTDVDSKILDEIKSIDLPSSYGTKIDTLAKHLHWIREHDPGAKSIVFSQFREFLDVLGGALKEFKIGFARLGRSGAAEKFRHDPSIDCLLLDAKTDSSGLTLVNATHVFVCEPLIQTAVELQAIARVHRIGQTRPTTVWMYLINDTVEEAIYEISVARRLAHVQSRQQQQQKKSSRSSTPAPQLQENAIDAANSEELQSAPLSKLLVAGKGGGELVGNDDLWQCLFGKAGRTKTNVIAEREVGRHLRAEAAEQRRGEESSV